MAGLISKPYTYTTGSTISSTEVNANEDALYTAINGGLNEDNFDGSTQIPNAYLVAIAPTKVDDYASSDLEFATVSAPGTSASLTKPTTLAGELEKLRYRFQANDKLLYTKYMDSGGSPVSIYWVETPPILTHQLLPNNGFEVKTSGTATDAPDGWTLFGTPTDLTVTTHASAGDTFGVDKRFLHVTGDANEGIQTTVSGLKKSTKYLIGMAYVRTAGTVAMSTTGGLSGAAYQNLDLSVNTGTSAAYLQGVVSTDTNGADITVKFHCGASSTEFAIYQVWMYEMADQSTLDIPHIPSQTATSDTQTDYAPGTNAWAWGTDSTLTLAQFVPAHGYRLIYEVTVSYTSENFSIDASDTITSPDNDYSIFGFRIQLDSGSGAATVAGPYVDASKNNGGLGAFGGVASLKYIVENPEPSKTYTFTTNVGCYGKSSGTWSQCRVNPLMEAEQSVSTARLIVERV